MLPEDSVPFRTDFPEYHSEYVGGTLSELVNEGVLVKQAQGIYAKSRRSRFGIVLPSVEKVVEAIATRDNTELLPSGMTALNSLGLSTQVPTNYCFLAISSERIWQAILELVAAITKVFSISDEEVLDAVVNESEELAHICELYQCKMAS